MRTELYSDLWFREGSSDKVYYLKLISDGGNKWQVTVAYGKRLNCNANNTTDKFMKPVDHPTANKMYEKLLKQKLAKGYEILEQS